MAQSVDALVSPPEYVPDRGVSPTLVFPDVRAVDSDNVFTHGAVNQYLGVNTLQWTVNGSDIEDVWTEGVDYGVITEESDFRGSLRVYKNLNAGEREVLKFSGKFLDWRTGVQYEVISDEKALVATEKGDDIYNCNVDKPLIEYDPLYDGLLLYDYKVANGISVSGTRASHVDGKSFEQSVSVVLTKGGSVVASLPTGVTMRLVVLGTNTAITANSMSHPEVMQASFPTVKFDMRMVAKGDYEVQFLKDGNVITRCTIGLCTKVTMPSDARPKSGVDISPSQAWYENSVLLNLSDRVVDYPELYYMIVWKTQAKVYANGVWSYDQEKIWQCGEKMGADVSQLGIGLTSNDSFFDIFFDVDAHPARELCLDEDSDVLLDENNEYLID